ncbi:zinc protease PQQL-like isoform X2 [Lycium ferocissimum]|nr:zinc protease PQQL-like isoform X2 [Lycium ferocissimum]XP_059276502.1 zinc protease PQQL-like isoform X2 [Lycium ferocissimum]
MVNLRKAIGLIAAISEELNFTAEELEKEKTIILDELWNNSQDGLKKHAHTFSAHLFQGAKYAEPIGGTKNSVQDVSVDIVKGFYTKWYVPNNMAVIVVGDVTETQSIIGWIRTYFESQPRGMPPHLEFPLPKYCEPRLNTHVDSAILKWGMSQIYITFMFEKQGWKFVNDVFMYIQQTILHRIIAARLKKRFLSMSRPKEIQYDRVDDLQMCTIYVFGAECKECETIEVLETLFGEIARMRVHGIEENELNDGISACLGTYEQAYLNRHDCSSKRLQDDYTCHFVSNAPELAPKLQAQLLTALTKSINMENMKSFCDSQCEASKMSVIVIQSKNSVTQEDMKKSLQKINDLEKEGCFGRWSDEEVKGSNNLILKMEIKSGCIVERVEHSDIRAVELILANGMQVTYQCTDDAGRVFLSGFSYGGLSELTEADLLSCSFSCLIGKSVWATSSEGLPKAFDTVHFNVEVEEYRRAFSADFDSSDIELALQIVYLLFTSDYEPEDEVMKAMVDELKERLSPDLGHLYHILENTAKEINSGGSYFYKPKAEDLSQVNTSKAWQYFKDCFRDPSNFRIILTGKFDSASLDCLLSHYLGGIPRPSMPIMEYQRGKLTPAPFHFPPGVTKEEVSMPMDSGTGMCTCISFPLHLKNETLVKDHFLL